MIKNDFGAIVHNGALIETQSDQPDSKFGYSWMYVYENK